MKITFTSDTHAGFSSSTDRRHIHKFLPQLAEEKPDLVLHAGDWGTSEPKHLERAFRQFRSALGDTPIVGVLGNHDYWDYKKESSSLDNLISKQQEWSRAYKITLLDGDYTTFRNEFESSVKIFGFTGWYGNTPEGSNDKFNIPSWLDADVYLRENARENFQKALDSSDCDINICVTHFPPYSVDPRWASFCANQMYFDPLCDKFNYLLVGHNHQNEDFYNKQCRVMTCGGDYDQPKYKSIEV